MEPPKPEASSEWGLPKEPAEEPPLPPGAVPEFANESGEKGPAPAEPLSPPEPVPELEETGRADPQDEPDERMRRPGRGRIITFYSYKGGTGRSMALANAAWALAMAGRSVLVMDWDLERRASIATSTHS